MTRKDFQLIANAIKTIPLIDDKAREVLGEHLADSLATTNPRFRRWQFVQACLVNEGK